MKLINIILLASLALNVNAETKPLPCENENNTAFNYWIGEWQVTTPDGKHAGDSVIERVQDGCVLQENWRSGQSDYTGTSYNSYNRADERWEQIWLDNKGGRLHLKGHKEDDQMILRSDAKPNKNGDASYNQITWTDNKDGTVRQYWEVITEGKPTTVSFDGLYKPVK